jgi:thiamine-phosphate pyrophosphorylase
MASTGIAGLYVITPDWRDTVKLLVAARAAIEGGAKVLQYRNKVAGPGLRQEHALGLSAVCAKFGAVFIVNDHLDLALEVEADGLHLGGADGDVRAARKKLGRGKLLGVSCYNSLELAQAAKEAGADHVAFGAVYPSTTKPGAVQASLELFRQARPLGLPVVAIGGITAGNAGPAIEAGASAVAVISDVFDAPDIGARARQYAALFSS